MTVIAGIGCRRLCPADDIIALIRSAASQAGRDPTALAAPSFKQAEPGLAEAASRLALPLLLVPDAELRAVQPLCPTRPDAGYPSVAEGSALAAAGPGARLILPRIAGPRATCALAEAP